jgi:hypothetical protein
MGEQPKVFRSPVHFILISELTFSVGLLVKEKKKKKKRKVTPPKESFSIYNPIYTETKVEYFTPFGAKYFSKMSRVGKIGFRDITPCSPFEGMRRFGGIYRFHIRGRRTSRARNQHESREQSERSACRNFGLYGKQERNERQRIGSKQHPRALFS